MLKKKIESLLFASGAGFKMHDFFQSFSGKYNQAEITCALEELEAQYNGESGIILIKYNDTYQFQTNPIYGEEIAEILTPIKEKALSKTLLEVLSIIAYQQPITRLEIEEIRGANPDYACAILLKLNLIDIVGRKNTMGRPVLYATTDEFLRKFALESLESLPDKEYLLNEIRNNFDKYYKDTDSLYRHSDNNDISYQENNDNELQIDLLKVAAVDLSNEEMIEESEIPDFLVGEDFIKLD